MKTTLAAAQDDVGAITWQLPANIQNNLDGLSEVQQQKIRKAMSLALSACAHLICVEADYAMSTGEPPMVNLMQALVPLTVAHNERLRAVSMSQNAPSSDKEQ